jgi:hypothetical protein
MKSSQARTKKYIIIVITIKKLTKENFQGNMKVLNCISMCKINSYIKKSKFSRNLSCEFLNW